MNGDDQLMAKGMERAAPALSGSSDNGKNRRM